MGTRLTAELKSKRNRVVQIETFVFITLSDFVLFRSDYRNYGNLEPRLYSFDGIFLTVHHYFLSIPLKSKSYVTFHIHLYCSLFLISTSASNRIPNYSSLPVRIAGIL